LLQWTNSPAVTTNGGVLVFNNGTSAASFTAEVVPEPTAVFLVLTALAVGVLSFRRPRHAWHV
jgi:hypothetical protein